MDTNLVEVQGDEEKDRPLHRHTGKDRTEAARGVRGHILPPHPRPPQTCGLSPRPISMHSAPRSCALPRSSLIVLRGETNLERELLVLGPAAVKSPHRPGCDKAFELA